MHRAEKASSKICREREVEKAQELHRRKIDGVKSYLTVLTRPAAPSVPLTRRPSTFFRRSQQQQQGADAASSTHHSEHFHSGSASSTALSGYSEIDNDDGDGGDASSEDGDGGVDDMDAIQSQAAAMSSTTAKPKNFDKLEELRSVLVPVMGYTGGGLDDCSGDLDYERYLDEITNNSHVDDEIHIRGPESVKHHSSSKSLHASAFRLRRLKQIKTDNVTLFDRIKNTAAHYRTEQFKKDWDQNVAYLSSICEFPVINETIHPPPRRHTRKRSPFASRPGEQLPSIQHIVPAAVHPIKAVPTSPRKPKQLNLSPAFRSLRKGLPQAPGLPPLTASPRAVLKLKAKQSMTAVAGSRSGFELDDAANPDASGSPPSPEARSPSPTHMTTADQVVDDPLRYTLLKIGRFVGGKYLVLTVFCGDGVTNPYGFDVIALDPETHLEFRLSITKETTHLLLDTISSSSMAERTGAAAGTNLSMELIARCICDHVRYASLGSCEMVFLVATVGMRGGLSGDTVDATEDEKAPQTSPVSVGDNPSLLLDSAYSALALSLHQHCCIPNDDGDREVHVFASTRPQQCCEASMACDSATGSSSSSNVEPLIDLNGTEYMGLVCYELHDGDGHSSLQSAVSAKLQLSVSSLLHQLEAERIEVDHDPRARLSLDRLVMLSLPFLHFHSTPATLALDLSKHNNWFSGAGSELPCRPSTTVLPRSLSTLPHTCSRSRLHTSSSRSPPCPQGEGDSLVSPRPPTQEDRKAVLQTGMLWRGAFLLARVCLLCPTRVHEETGKRIRDPRDELLVFNVFNSSTGSYAERIVDGDQVEAFSQRLGAWQSESPSVPSPLIVFAKHLLLRLRLEVDLRGHEIIHFPTLEPRYHSASARGSSSPRQRQSPNKLPMKMIQDDDPFPLAEDDDEDAGEDSGNDDDEFDSQEQEEAATAIQALGRGFLSRLHQRRVLETESPTEMPQSQQYYSRDEVFYRSLSPEQHEFVRYRAAKRILVACRSFVDRTRRRKRALVDVSGFAVKTPRSLTPTVPSQPREGSLTFPHHSRVSQPSLASSHVATSEANSDSMMEKDTSANQKQGDEDQASEEDDDGMEEPTTRHVDMLGALEEEDAEDTKVASLTGLVPIQAPAAELSHTNHRVGKKVLGLFTLVRYSSDTLDFQRRSILECRAIGTLGEFLSIDSEP